MDVINLEKHIPWVVFKAKNWIDSYLNENMFVFEWGSGGSTIYFANRVKKVISIEHSIEWYEKVSNTIGYEKIKNCDYFLIEPQKSSIAQFLPYGSYTYVSKTFKEHSNLLFKKYVRKIDEYPDEKFDLIMIDGRSRAACINHAVKKVKKGGYLLLDNSERDIYLPVMKKLNRFTRHDFFGNGPFSEEKWQTTIWQIK
ncbi:MAG: hypothetical protein ABI761_15670 [Saprospiraceae bacterium]